MSIKKEAKTSWSQVSKIPLNQCIDLRDQPLNLNRSCLYSSVNKEGNVSYLSFFSRPVSFSRAEGAGVVLAGLQPHTDALKTREEEKQSHISPPHLKRRNVPGSSVFLQQPGIHGDGDITQGTEYRGSPPCVRCDCSSWCADWPPPLGFGTWDTVYDCPETLAGCVGENRSRTSGRTYWRYRDILVEITCLMHKQGGARRKGEERERKEGRER